jgi:hypothetical protein
MKRMLIVLMLGVATMMAPISASATVYTNLGAWQTDVGSYANVAIPAADYSAWSSINLPSGGGDFFNIDNNLTYLSGFYYTPFDDRHANGAFYPGGSSGPISAFGFEVKPYVVESSVNINVYTAYGVTSYGWIVINYSPRFFGWIGDDVIAFSTCSTATYGLGNFVEDPAVQDPAVPEPATMLLLGSGLIGLWGLKRKYKK